MRRGAFAQFLLFFLILLPISRALAFDDAAIVTEEPHLYDGPRGDEPRFQNVIRFDGLWQSHDPADPKRWKIATSYETETLGRHDSSLELNEAWLRVPLGDPDSGPAFFLGRIHPWAVSGSPEANRPWGLLAQQQSENRGILLGAPVSDSAFPRPQLLGWLGAHFWSGNQDVAWGLSASPLFVPNLGSAVALSEDTDTSASRFGRRPPGSVLVNGVSVPLRYRIDQSRIIQDILLQPQVMAQLRWKPSSQWNAWASVSRAPTPEGDPSVSGFLRVTGTGVSAVAEVEPRFPERWMADLHQRLGLTRSTYLFNSLVAIEGGRQGYEAGFGLAPPTSGAALEVSFLDETGPEHGAYTRYLLQAEGRLALGHGLGLLAGIKQNLQDSGTWIRSMLSLRASAEATLDVGFDLFGGGDDAYFGEWRTNDRLFAGLSWRFR